MSCNLQRPTRPSRNVPAAHPRYTPLLYGFPRNNHTDISCNLPHNAHPARPSGLLFSPSSERPQRSVKKGRLFERSEFLPFSEVKEASRRKKSALNFSLLLSFVSRQKKDDCNINVTCMTPPCNVKSRPLQPETTYTYIYYGDYLFMHYHLPLCTSCFRSDSRSQ